MQCKSLWIKASAKCINVNVNTSKHNMQFLNEGVFLWRENKIQTHMALCEKVFAPHPLLKHNCGLSHLSSVSLATSRPDYCHTCSQSRNHLNRTCLTKWSRPKDPQKLHIMLRSKEIQEQMRKKVIEIYQSGKGYKAISKALGLQRTTVRAIIHKWRKHGTVVNLPRSGRPTKITPRAQWRLIQEVTKDPTTTSKELQASLASVKVSVHDSTIRKRLGKNGLHGRVPRRKPLLSKKLISVLPENILMIPKTFGKILCGLTRQKLNFLEGVCPITSGVKVTQHFRKRTSCQQ